MKISALLPDKLFGYASKLLVLLFSFACISILITANANAQTSENYYDNSSYETTNSLNLEKGVELSSHNAIQALMFNFLSAISCQLGGVDPVNPGGKCLGVNKETGEIGYVENSGGAILAVGKLIDFTLTPPTSGVQYIAYLKNNFGISEHAYAQNCRGNPEGVGFCSIEPLLDVWIVMRNIVYLLFVLVFVVIGLGIMLRFHIDPRTVMTVQNQIPKIIIGILAITFSFAIAGFLIDIMWVAVYLFANVILQVSGTTGLNLNEITQATNPFQAANAAWPGDGEWGVFDMGTVVASAFTDIISGYLNTLNWGIIGDVVVGIVNILAIIIIFIAILVSLIRLWISLLFAFINIILDIIMAPWWILAGFVPGSPISLSSWMRDLIANLAVFPVAIGFLLLGNYLMTVYWFETTNRSTIAFPLLGGVTPQAIAVLIGFGFILMLPSLLNTVKAALKTPKMNFGNMMSPVSAGAGFLAGSATRGYSGWRGWREARSVTGLPKFDEQGKYLGHESDKVSVTAAAKRMFMGGSPKKWTGKS